MVSKRLSSNMVFAESSSTTIFAQTSSVPFVEFYVARRGSPTQHVSFGQLKLTVPNRAAVPVALVGNVFSTEDPFAQGGRLPGRFWPPTLARVAIYFALGVPDTPSPPQPPASFTGNIVRRCQFESV